MSTRQQRRASDRAAARRGARSAGGWPGLIAMGIVILAVGGWLLWGAFGRSRPVRDGAPAWSPDSRRIVYYSERDDGHGDLFVMNADGTDVQPLTETDADEGGPAFSPDGRQIAFDTDRDHDFEIYVMNVDGTNLRRLTNNPARDLSPAWSPDGTRIAFMSDRDARPEFDVYVMNADGSNVERLTTEGTSWFPQFDPSGQHLAFHVWRDVNVLDLSTRVLERLTADPNNGMYPTWSPDGREIAFMSWRNGQTEIFTMNADGTNQQRLVTMPSGSAIDPRWSPDGTRIVFVHVPERTALESQDAGQERAIYVVEIATGRLSRLSR